MGQGGGQFDLTQRAIAAQGASNNAATQGLQQAAMAEASRENALGQMANIGGNINASDFGQAAARAGAQDTINAGNTASKNATSAFNIGNNFNAQANNINNAQGVNAANTAANQGMTYYNANLPQQQFNNELQKAAGVAGVNQAQAGAAQTSAANQSAGTGQLLKGGLTLAATAYGGPAGGMAANAALNSGAQGKKMGTYADGGVVEEPHNHFLCMLNGGCVPGEPKMAGDSAQNDTVPAMLSPGEIVIPRSKAGNPDAAAKEAKKIALSDFTKSYRKVTR